MKNGIEKSVISTGRSPPAAAASTRSLGVAFNILGNFFVRFEIEFSDAQFNFEVEYCNVIIVIEYG